MCMCVCACACACVCVSVSESASARVCEQCMCVCACVRARERAKWYIRCCLCMVGGGQKGGYNVATNSEGNHQKLIITKRLQ